MKPKFLRHRLSWSQRGTGAKTLRQRAIRQRQLSRKKSKVEAIQNRLGTQLAVDRPLRLQRTLWSRYPARPAVKPVATARVVGKLRAKLAGCHRIHPLLSTLPDAE